MRENPKRTFINVPRAISGAAGILICLGISAGLGAFGDIDSSGAANAAMSIGSALLGWIFWVFAVQPRVGITASEVTLVQAFHILHVPRPLVARFSYDQGVSVELRKGRRLDVESFSPYPFYGLPGHPYLKSRCRAMNASLAQLRSDGSLEHQSKLRRTRRNRLLAIAPFALWALFWSGFGLLTH